MREYTAIMHANGWSIKRLYTPHTTKLKVCPLRDAILQGKQSSKQWPQQKYRRNKGSFDHLISLNKALLKPFFLRDWMIEVVISSWWVDWSWNFFMGMNLLLPPFSGRPPKPCSRNDSRSFFWANLSGLWSNESWRYAKKNKGFTKKTPTPPKFKILPLKNYAWIGRLLSFWDGIFSGAMLNFQGYFNLRSGWSTPSKTNECPRKMDQCKRKTVCLPTNNIIFQRTVCSFLREKLDMSISTLLKDFKGPLDVPGS